MMNEITWWWWWIKVGPREKVSVGYVLRFEWGTRNEAKYLSLSRQTT